VSPSAHEQWMEELLDRAQTVVSPRPPRNVLERVGAVLRGQTIRYVDPDLSGDMSDDLISGRICVFTDSFLAVVDVEGVPTSYVNVEPGSNTGRVSVEFVARSTLARSPWKRMANPG
jgi:hypothetical protein